MFQAKWEDYDIQKTVIYNETDGKVIDFKLKVKRHNRTTYVITGGIDVNFDSPVGLDVRFTICFSIANIFSAPTNKRQIFYENIYIYIQAEIEFWHSAVGNNQWQLTPYRVPRKPICEFFNGEYKKLLMEDLHKVSKLPFSENDKEDICPQLLRVHNIKFN